MLECTVLPITGQSQKWKVAKWMPIVYCFGWKPSVYWITLNGSWMIHQCFSLIVWKMKCALHKLFAWQCLLFMSSSSIMLGCHAYQTLRRPEQSAKSKPALPKMKLLLDLEWALVPSPEHWQSSGKLGTSKIGQGVVVQRRPPNKKTAS